MSGLGTAVLQELNRLIIDFLTFMLSCTRSVYLPVCTTIQAVFTLIYNFYNFSFLSSLGTRDTYVEGQFNR